MRTIHFLPVFSFEGGRRERETTFSLHHPLLFWLLGWIESKQDEARCCEVKIIIKKKIPIVDDIKRRQISNVHLKINFIFIKILNVWKSKYPVAQEAQIKTTKYSYGEIGWIMLWLRKIIGAQGTWIYFLSGLQIPSVALNKPLGNKS